MAPGVRRRSSSQTEARSARPGGRGIQTTTPGISRGCAAVAGVGGCILIAVLEVSPPMWTLVNRYAGHDAPLSVAAWHPSACLRTFPYSHSIINSFGKSLIGLMQEPQRRHVYRQSYRHFVRHPRAQRSPPIDIYREQSAVPQYSAVEVYRDLSRLRIRFLWREGAPRSARTDQGDVGIKGLKLLSHRVFVAILSPPSRSRSDAVRQCASAVCSAASFHGLIFASVFARLAFATSVS